MNKLLILACFAFVSEVAKAQVMNLDSILNKIQQANPVAKMYDYEVRSMDEAAKGAKSWMPPEFGAGFWMTPYSPKYWKADDMGPGMGSFMLSAQQMFPNKQKQNAEASYMQVMSSVEKERKKSALNDLYAEAKKNYYQLLIVQKKLKVIEGDEKLLNFMIQNAEIRYKNGLEKISAYYKAKAALGNLEKMKLMLQNEIVQASITLNTLMNKDKNETFQVDTNYVFKDYSTVSFDSSTFINARSDIKAIEKNISLNYLQQNVERAKLKPEFGIRYDHMVAWARQPWQFSLMGMVKIPLGRSTLMNRANIESLKWKTESLNQQKQMIINDATGMAYSMRNEIETKQKQIKLYQDNIIPALRNNYKTMQLGYEQNTEELFMLFDAWETLNMTQLDWLDQLQQLLIMQSELEKILEVK